MGRKPLKKKAMTAAERQARHRKKVRKEELELGKKAEREKKRIEEGRNYIPTPPGVTYWQKKKVVLATGEIEEKYYPVTRPLASMHWHELTDADLDALQQCLEREREGRRNGRRGAGGGGLGVCGEQLANDPAIQALAERTAKLLSGEQEAPNP